MAPSTPKDAASPNQKGGLPKPEEWPPQAPLYLCSERKRVEILFKLD